MRVGENDIKEWEIGKKGEWEKRDILGMERAA